MPVGRDEPIELPYQPQRREEEVLRQWLKELAGERRRFGFRRLAILLRRKV